MKTQKHHTSILYCLQQTQTVPYLYHQHKAKTNKNNLTLILKSTIFCVVYSKLQPYLYHLHKTKKLKPTLILNCIKTQKHPVLVYCKLKTYHICTVYRDTKKTIQSISIFSTKKNHILYCLQ